jgi:hypothetical protein
MAEEGYTERIVIASNDKLASRMRCEFWGLSILNLIDSHVGCRA